MGLSENKLKTRILIKSNFMEDNDIWHIKLKEKMDVVNVQHVDMYGKTLLT